MKHFNRELLPHGQAIILVVETSACMHVNRAVTLNLVVSQFLLDFVCRVKYIC